MKSNVCMNGLCGTTTSSEWKKGWVMKSGGNANLCYNCGIAFDNMLYCEKFHLNESGWRECKFCEKPIHCGCIVSKYLHDFLDFGDIACITCLSATANRSLGPSQNSSDDIRNHCDPVTAIGDSQSAAMESQIFGISGEKGKLVQLSEGVEKHQLLCSTPSYKADPTISIGNVKRESKALSAGKVGAGFSSALVHNALQLATQESIPLPVFDKSDNSAPILRLKDTCESYAPASLTFSQGGPQGSSNSEMSTPVRVGVVESKEPDKVPRLKIYMSKHPKPGSDLGSGFSAQSPQANIRTPLESQVARPPVEGHGQNQLLSRYRPKITDEELEKISRDLNSNIVPLFEKMLSPSDAGRIGRFVLPKACAEAYFPPISNSEGMSMSVQDIKGNEWTFQFRFWPNNNSRMYILEGVNPCIKTMKLQAGDTVTFSRMEPGNKFLIGCRKAKNSVDAQKDGILNLPTGPRGETSHTGDNGHTVHRSRQVQEKKSRNIGSKSKRLLMHSEDAMDLMVTWEEAQELLHPPPRANKNVVKIENYEFEEYDEPPVLGKKTRFTTQVSGEPEQWAQCDNCFKWRRLPLDIFLPSRWTCSDNIWDPRRCSCSAPDELNARELERIFGPSKDSKKRRRNTEKKMVEEEERTGLETLALVAVLEESMGDLEEPSQGAASTTKHPRHKPGCTCIVCIQPPSGQEKHKFTCLCDMCLLVKRRFKTRMLRKQERKKREREAEILADQGKDRDNLQLVPYKEDENGSPESTMLSMNNNNNNHYFSESGRDGIERDIGEISKGQLDLNCDLNREDDEELMVDAGSLPLERCVNSPVLSRAASETDEYPPEHGCSSSMVEACDESKGDDEE